MGGSEGGREGWEGVKEEGGESGYVRGIFVGLSFIKFGDGSFCVLSALHLWFLVLQNLLR